MFAVVVVGDVVVVVGTVTVVVVVSGASALASVHEIARVCAKVC